MKFLLSALALTTVSAFNGQLTVSDDAVGYCVQYDGLKSEAWR